MDGVGAIAFGRCCPAAIHASGEHEDRAVAAGPCRGGALGGSVAVRCHDYDVEEGVDVAGTAGVGKEEAGICWRVGVSLGFGWLIDGGMEVRGNRMSA